MEVIYHLCLAARHFADMLSEIVRPDLDLFSWIEQQLIHIDLTTLWASWRRLALERASSFLLTVRMKM